MTDKIKEQQPFAWHCKATREEDIDAEDRLVVVFDELTAKDYERESEYEVTPLYAAPLNLEAERQKDAALIEQLQEVIWNTNKYIDQTFADLVGQNVEWLAARYADSLSPNLSKALKAVEEWRKGK